MRLRLRVMTSAVTVLAALMFTPPVSAQAATCYASSCAGKSPEATGCSAGATTPRSTTWAGRIIELRYSPTCRSAWGRIRNGVSGDEIAVFSSGPGPIYTSTVRAGNSAYTSMVNDAGLTAWVCILGTSICTGSY